MTITNEELFDIEKWCGELFFNSKSKKEMTFHFTYHFSGERINDSRNNPLISLIELKSILQKFKNKHLDALYDLKHEQSYVVKCIETKINMIFSIEETESKGFNSHRNIAVTIIRKKCFKPYEKDIIFEV